MGLPWSSYAQIQRSPTPVTGHYPGGHVGLLGGGTPEPGAGYVDFNRFHTGGTLKDAQGNTIEQTDKVFYANINVITFTSKKKILGMNYGMLLALPFNDIATRPAHQSGTTTGFGIGDLAFVPFGLYGKSKSFDYQVGAGLWTPTGKFTPGASNNHGSGFWEMIYSLGGVYYPDGNRRSWSISGVARIEQNFTQSGTGINVGDDIVIDYGVGKLMIFGKSFKHVFDFGVSGFATTQFTHESGTNAALNTSLYRVFALGPEVRYKIPKWKLGFIVRSQWDFGAVNTSQGYTLWLAAGYAFPANK